jgi:hypothetical protein
MDQGIEELPVDLVSISNFRSRSEGTDDFFYCDRIKRICSY